MTTMSKPNIVFFFTDDQRFDTIAALGNPEIKTPHLDELVQNGVSFTKAHIPGGTVGAVCMPSRAMLQTGRTLFHLERNGETIPAEHALLGETLRQAGYRTFGTGKWHNGASSYARSFTDGDEIFFGGMADHWNVPVYRFDPSGAYTQTLNKVEKPSVSNKITKYRADHVHAGKHSSEMLGESARRWMEQAGAESEPFFMYISFLAPHDPRTMPERFLNLYDPEKLELPENFKPEHPFDYGVRSIRDEVLAPYPRSEEEIRRHIAEYYGMISHLDDEIGKVISVLKQTGKYEHTIIVFAGDNGLALGQHGLMGKQSAYEHSIRVPLIFCGPGIPKNETRETYAYLLDIFPTLCSMVGIPIPPTVEGIDLLPAIRNKHVVARDSLYFAYAGLLRAVKDDRYKLIEYRTNGMKETQLFDLLEDPSETINLFGKSEYEAILNILTEKMLHFREAWDDCSHPTGQKFWSLY